MGGGGGGGVRGGDKSLFTRVVDIMYFTSSPCPTSDYSISYYTCTHFLSYGIRVA